MQQKLKLVDCVIEVHDARIPFSGRNSDFKHTVTGIKPHILVLNKKDLSDERANDRTAEKIRKEEGISHVLYTNCKDHQCKGVKRIIPVTKELISNSNRYNRSEESDFALMIIGVPNVGKSSLINVLRNRHLKMKGATAVGNVAGITRSVLTRIKISEKPPIYLLDTPGILTPKVTDSEQGMKLALTSCLQDHLVGYSLIADYLLYWMNKNQRFDYVEFMGLQEPTDIVEEVLLAGSKTHNKSLKIKNFDGQLVLKPDFEATAKEFVRAFRVGAFGKVNLDNNIIS